MPEQEIKAIITEEKISNPCTDVRYPQVGRLKNKEVENQINEQIQNLISDLLPHEGCDVYDTIQGVYQIGVNQKGILSMRFEVYTFRIRAANGSTVVQSLTADVTTGQTYQLHELFRRNSHYRIVLTNMIRQQIQERDLPLIKEFNGITDYENFYLTENNLVIYFQEMEYTPHYVGVPEFPIPYTKIRNLINPDGPIAKLI